MALTDKKVLQNLMICLGRLRNHNVPMRAPSLANCIAEGISGMNSKHDIGWQLPSRGLKHTASNAAPRNMLLLVLLIDEFKGRAKCLFSQKSLVENDHLCATQDY